MVRKKLQIRKLSVELGFIKQETSNQETLSRIGFHQARSKNMQSGAWEPKVLLWIFALCLFGFAIICHAQDQSGFISIDCGLTEGSEYRDDATDIPYSTDADFLDTGENHIISRDYINDSLERQLWRVRSFPYGQRNCYNLSAGAGGLKGHKYLIRATFMYGNYDSKNQTPIFNLHLGVEFWTAIAPNTSNSIVREEIIHVPSSNFLYVCLVNTGSGTPFISALELRPLIQNAYPTHNESLTRLLRKNFAPETDKIIIRHPNDEFDRIWEPHPTPLDWVGLSTMEPIDNSAHNNYRPPSTVMRTAVTPRNASLPLEFNWKPPNPTEQLYVYFHFAEVQKLSSNESRQFFIYHNNELWHNEIMSPQYLSTNTIYVTSGNSEASFEYLLKKTRNSTLPPSINAVEVYMVKQFLKSQTDEKDVLAMVNIKFSYGVKRLNWQGDPCLPKAYLWEGLDCIVSDDETIPPRIKFLNLSSSGLTGNVSLYLSNLTSLEYLDLSSNSLTGLVPDFLAELPSLKVLNLTGNNFSGSIPQKLVDKATNGLILRIDGFESESPNLCQSIDGSECKKKKSNPKSLIASLIILASLIVLWRIRLGSRDHDVPELESESNRNNGFLDSKRLQLTYSKILEMTNNFERVLGKGGFGTVYFGEHAGNQVAVKVLSPSSVQGYNEFQTEAELLTRVHHRNLTTLVGYCYEDNKTVLVYEYMANGNLRKVLSDNHDVLSWLGRLQIAMDAALGLDYLHNGCKPAIIHRDIKSTNILLNEKFEAKLADFGLSRACSTEDGSFISTRVMGTLGYIDPEYCGSQKLHEKSDIYSLGVVILELITGRLAVFKGNQEQQQLHITQWVNHLVVTADIETIVDPKLNGDYDTNSAWKALEVAMDCSSSSSSKRPSLAHVIKELSECLAAERARREGSTTYSEDIVQVDLVSSEIIQPRPR